MHELSVKNDQYIWARSPVRLDLAGGWSDTPPFTFRHGGKVVNVAVNLNDELPVQVYIRRSEEPRIKVQSIDLGTSEIINDLKQIENHTSPHTSFGITKAALHLLGFNKETIGKKKTLTNYLKSIGGGFDVTLFVAVPRGSGLGVSSILSATLLGALHKLFGQEGRHHDLLNQALKVEQMLTTGGGWQDQVGGMFGGIKYIESQPCAEEKAIVSIDTEHLDSFLFEDRGNADCITLFYTGISRLANNILKKVVNRVNMEDLEYLDVHHNIKRLADNAKIAISRRNLLDLGEIVANSWEANKKIEETTTNDYIENLLNDLRKYYIGAKLLGAGGGGYCLFISETPEKANKLKKILSTTSKGNSRLVDWKLNEQGLRVSVS